MLNTEQIRYRDCSISTHWRELRPQTNWMELNPLRQPPSRQFTASFTVRPDESSEEPWQEFLDGAFHTPNHAAENALIVAMLVVDRKRDNSPHQRDIYGDRLSKLQSERRSLIAAIEDAKRMGTPCEQLKDDLRRKQSETDTFRAYLSKHS